MQLVWVPSKRRYLGTQTEAAKAKVAFEVREVPTVKADLIAFLNGREEEHDAEIDRLTSGASITHDQHDPDDAEDAVQTDTVPTAAARAPISTTSTPRQLSPMAAAVELSDRISELEAKELAPVLSAAIGRLGELAGNRGWGIFSKNVYAWSPAARTVEQGLGMLMLAAMDSLRQDAPEKPRPIEPVAGAD